MGKINEITKRIETLNLLIENAAKKREEVISLVSKLTFELSSGKISKREYYDKLGDLLKLKTPEEWTRYYDNYISDCKLKIIQCRQFINEESSFGKKETAGKVLQHLVFIALIGVVVALIYNFGPAVYDSFSHNLNVPGVETTPGNIPSGSTSISGESPGVSTATPSSVSEGEFLNYKPVSIVSKNKNPNFEETSVQGTAVVGENVKWQSEVKMNSLESFDINIPKNSKIISIKDETGKEIDSKNNLEGGKTYNVEFETPAPKISKEIVKTSGERVVVESYGDIHYKDILSTIKISENLDLKKTGKQKLKLYQIYNENGVETKVPVDFILYDTNEDGTVDSLEWVVTHLSSAEFEFVIIEISKAEHLDSERKFISDIYENVKTQEGIWSEKIRNSEYVRVSFEQNLTNKNDITLYARGANFSVSQIEVYRKDSEEIVAKFENISSEDTYKIYLTSLFDGENYESFDLKIIGEVEFDYIVDPTGLGITSCSQLQGIGGVTGTCAGKFYLVDNIDCTGYSFTPLCAGGFTGNFDGNHKYIKNLRIIMPSNNYVGLFSIIRGANITDLIFENISLKGMDYVGAVAGYSENSASSYSYIHKCYARGNFEASHQVGGIVGTAIKTVINNSYAVVNVTSTVTSGDSYAGGIAGQFNYGNITNSYVIGNVTGKSLTGGVVGYSESSYQEHFSVRNTFSNVLVRGNSLVGEVAGDAGSFAFFETLYYYDDSDDTSNCYGAGTIYGGCNLISDLSTIYLKTHNVYTVLDPVWDFTNIWSERSNNYPIFQWQYKPPIITMQSIGGDTISPFSTNNPVVFAATNEAATCRYAATDLAYNSMTYVCQTTGGTSHACIFSGVPDSPSRTFYVACIDSEGDFNTALNNGELIAELDTVKPVQSGWNPISGSTITTTSPIVTFNTNELAICKYAINTGGDLSYSSMTLTCDSGFTTSHSCSVTGLLQGANNVYVACADDTDSIPNEDSAATNKHLSYNVDTIYPQINFTYPTPPNNTVTTNKSIVINVSISEPNLNEVKFNWNGTNFTMYNDSLVLMYNLDNVALLGESSTVVKDLSKYGNDGTVLNGATWTPNGKYNGAYSFDGSDDYIQISKKLIENNSNGSYSAWIYANPTSKNEMILTQGMGGVNNNDCYSLFYNANTNTIYYGYTNGATGNGGNYVYDLEGKWVYLTVVWNSSNSYLYINGTKVSSGANPFCIQIPSDYFIIGERSWISGDNYFNGLIDEVRIWNRSLTSNEVYEQYVSNLNKYNQTQWYLYVNQSNNSTTGLDPGNYTYFAFVKDIVGYENITEKKYIQIKENLDVSTCRDLTSPNSVYNLTQSFSATKSVCINFLAENITLNCKGFTITANDNLLIYSNQYNSTIFNCSLIDIGTGPGGYLLNLDVSANNSTIFNTTISRYVNLVSVFSSGNNISNNKFTAQMGGNALYLGSSNSNKLYNNYIYGNFGSGVYLSASSNNVFINVTGYSNGQPGINIQSGSNNNNFSYLNGTSMSSHGIYISESNNNIFNNTIGQTLTSEYFGIQIFNSNNLFIDCLNVSGVNGDVSVTGPGINSFVNCSYDKNKEGVFAGGQLIRRWYYRAYVNDTFGRDIDRANVSGYNRTTLANIFNLTTNSSGWTNITEIIDYVNTGGTRQYYSNYTINATNGTWRDQHTYNATLGNNLFDVFTIGLGGNPQINFTYPTPPNNTITPNKSIEINVSINSLDLNEVKFNWNGTNFTMYNDSLVLIYNFDNVALLGESSAVVKDLSKYGNDGAVLNGATPVSNGKYNGAYSFDGSDDYISVANSNNLNFGSGPFTILVWVKANYKASTIIAKGTQWIDTPMWGISYANVPQKLYVMVGNSNSHIEYNTDLGTLSDWTQVGLMRDSLNRIYFIINGTLIDTGYSVVGSVSNSNNIGIGNTYGYLNGQIDEVRIWDSSLNSDEVYEQYVSNLNKFNSTQWYLYVNQSKNSTNGLDIGNYTYFAFAKDSFGNENLTEKRFIQINSSVPEIYYVETIPNIDPRAGGVRDVYCNFSVFDADGYTDINSSSIKVNFTKNGVTRQNTTCTLKNAEGNYANYSCIVPMWFFDIEGYWDISISISDYSKNSDLNNTNSFQYNPLYEFDMKPTGVNWSNLVIGIPNQLADNNLTLYNLGNKNMSKITINASNLIGEKNNLYNLSAGNFTVDGCGSNKMVENFNVSSILTINFTDSRTIYNASGNLTFCVRDPILNVYPQSYSSSRDWIIDVTFALAAFALKRKRKKKKGLDSQILKIILENKTEIINILRSELAKKEAIETTEETDKTPATGTESEIKTSIPAQEKTLDSNTKLSIPIEIFSSELGSSEALVKYLHEVLKLKFSEIARLTSRDPRTIWNNYNNSNSTNAEKEDGKFVEVFKSEIQIPIFVFSDRRLSILESIVKYLRENGYKNYEISEILKKDERNIGTFYSRATKKIK